MNSKQLTLIGGITLLLLLSGCADNARVKRLNEKQIDEQESIADQARQKFYCGRYEQIPALIEPLCQEQTTSQPLYLCELGSCYLASNNKSLARQYLLEAYTSIEGFFDPTSEKNAMSLWGAEAEKVYKGEPFEQATLSMFVGLLLLEEGDVDNALACFKNGQIADSDVEKEEYKSDYGLLQMLEAKCYQVRGEQLEYDQFVKKAIDSFANTHPLVRSMRSDIAAGNSTTETCDDEERQTQENKIRQTEENIIRDYSSYYANLLKPYNTLLLIWLGRSPEMKRIGQYGEARVLIECPLNEIHYEIQLDNSSWHDAIRGFADVSFQATTRGGRQMSNVLANQAAFKSSAHHIGDTMFDAADNTSDPYAQLILIGAGLISHGIGEAANVKADIRSWKTLPREIAVVPLQLTAGTHQVRIDCYDDKLRMSRSINQQIEVKGRTFQFYNLIIPSAISPEPKKE